jgi:hypothetical protein
MAGVAVASIEYVRKGIAPPVGCLCRALHSYPASLICSSWEQKEHDELLILEPHQKSGSSVITSLSYDQ